MNLTIQMDMKPVSHMMKHISKQILPVATARALNKTVQAGQTVAVKQIAKHIGVKQTLVRKALHLTKAWRSKHVAVLNVISKKRLTLLQIDPNAKQNSQGVKYRSSMGSKLLPHTFIATMKSGHRGIYARLGSKRLPIVELQGPSIAHVFMQPTIQTAIHQIVAERWPTNMTHEIQFALQRKGFTR